jgi:biopolymer transport protein ExbD
MKSLFVACLIAGSLMFVTAQEQYKPALRQGVSVQMPVARHAVEMRAADEPDATIIAVTADGKVFIGVKPAHLDSLSDLSAGTVYLKADARVQYQEILAVLEALRGKRILLLTAAPGKVETGAFLPPYGVEVKLVQ